MILPLLLVKDLLSQIQKELLDAEMELFTLQQDGEETHAVQQKVTLHTGAEDFFIFLIYLGEYFEIRGGQVRAAPY